MSLFSVLVLGCACLATSKPFPVLSNNFVVHSVEVDDTTNESVVVTQTLIMNQKQRCIRNSYVVQAGGTV